MTDLVDLGRGQGWEDDVRQLNRPGSPRGIGNTTDDIEAHAQSSPGGQVNRFEEIRFSLSIKKPQNWTAFEHDPRTSPPSCGLARGGTQIIWFVKLS